MPAKTAYQKQADKRTKDALRLRARCDGRVRKYAAQVVAALAGALDAQARLDRVNLLYGVDISTETLLVHDVRTAGLGGQLGGLLGQSEPGEELQLFNPTVNANAGLVLELEQLFGELGAGTTPSPTPTPTPTPTYGKTLLGPNDSADGVTLAAQAGDSFSYNPMGTGGAAPVTMDLYRNGEQLASVTYFDRYNGQSFRFVSQLGTFAGVFASGSVSL